jgi:hypothetical protein
MPIFLDSYYTLNVTIQDADGEAEDISTWTLVWQFWQGKDKVVELSTGSGIAFTTDGTDGKFDLTLTDAQASLFAVGTTRIFIFRTDGNRTVQFEGTEVVEGPGFDA